MASGSANVVEILVQATNDTAGGFGAAKAGADETAAAMDEYAAASERAAAAQTELADAQARLDEVQADGSATADDLAAAQDTYAAALDRASAAAVASMDAQIKLGEAELEASDSAKVAGDASLEAGAKSDESSGLMAGAGGKAKMALLGIAVGAGVAVKAAMDYQEQSTQLVTGAGELKKNLGMVEQGMLELSASTATSTSQLESGMYMIESAGYHGAAGLDVLKAAAEGAKVGNADLGTVANATTTVLTDYHMSADQASAATSGLVEIVASGKTHMEDLASSMSKVLPTAAALKVSFPEVGGALATMTSQGISAKNAAMELNTTMISMAAPTKVQTTAMKEVGLASSQVASTLTHQGLIAAIQEVTDAAGKKFPVGSAQYVAALNAMLGGHRGLQVALALSGKNMADFKANTDSVSQSMRDGKKDVQGWAETQKDASFQVEKAKDSIKAMGIELGMALLPAVQAILGPLDSFLAMIAKNRVAAIAFATIIGGVLAGALGGKLAKAFTDLKSGIEGTFDLVGKLAGKMGFLTAATEEQTAAQEGLDAAEDANPIGLIVLAIVALIAIIVLLATHWKQVWGDIKNWSLDAWHFLKAVFDDIVKAVEDLAEEQVRSLTEAWDEVKEAAEAVWSWIKDYIDRQVDAIKAILSWFADLGSLFRGWWDDALNAVTDVAGDLVSFVASIPGRILSALGDLGTLLFSAGQNVLIGLLNGIESMVGAVVSAAENVGSSILSSIKGALGIGSPSRITYQHGRWLAEGLINGMDSMYGPLSAAAARMAGGAVPGRYGAGGAGGGAVIHLEIGTGGMNQFEQAFITWLRQQIRVKGGNVQLVLGH